MSRPNFQGSGQFHSLSSFLHPFIPNKIDMLALTLISLFHFTDISLFLISFELTLQ